MFGASASSCGVGRVSEAAVDEAVDIGGGGGGKEKVLRSLVRRFDEDIFKVYPTSEEDGNISGA